MAFNDRDDVVEGIVQMTKGGNAAKIVEALKIKVDEVNARLPEGYRLARSTSAPNSSATR